MRTTDSLGGLVEEIGVQIDQFGTDELGSITSVLLFWKTIIS